MLNCIHLKIKYVDDTPKADVESVDTKVLVTPSLNECMIFALAYCLATGMVNPITGNKLG